MSVIKLSDYQKFKERQVKEIRVYELAKELNITNRKILNVIEKYTDVKVFSHMSSVDPSSANEIITAVKIWRKKNENTSDI